MSPLLFFTTQAYHLITSMASFSSTVLLLLISLMAASFIAVSAGTLYEDIDIKWGDDRAKILNNGQLLTLSLHDALPIYSETGSSINPKEKSEVNVQKINCCKLINYRKSSGLV